MAVYTKLETKTATITIATSTTISAVVELGASALLGIEMPAAFTGTTLAIHGCSTSTGTFSVLTLANFTNPISVAADGRYSIDPALTAGWPYIKLVSGTAEVANRSISLLCRPV
jgi:hypothetical protein